MPEAQAQSSWTPPRGTLGALAVASAVRAAAAAANRTQLEAAAARRPAPASFAGALREGKAVAVIAEIKRRSPSRGAINPDIDAVAQARGYAAGGAAAISVLTETESFGGSLADLESVSAAVRRPTLRKDFIMDEVQLLEARAHGAAAALLIARALPPGRMESLIAFAGGIALETLVEIRDERELERALAADARVIGVNHRDLETLVIDVNAGERLLPLIPSGRIAVAESGIGSREDVARMAEWGADAVLVGSLLSAGRDPEAAVRALSGVQRVGRG